KTNQRKTNNDIFETGGAWHDLVIITLNYLTGSNHLFSMGKLYIKVFIVICISLCHQAFSQKEGKKKDKKGNPEQSIDTTFPATVTVAANPQLKGTSFKRFLIGKNYRREWTEPVTVPVLSLKTFHGSLKPV